MTITFYILLMTLNITNQRKKFDWSKLEHKVSIFFLIYTMLWLLVLGMTIFTYFVNFPAFIISTLLLMWLGLELFYDKAILIYGKNKEILKKEFMDVNQESVDQSLKEQKQLKKK